jgi:hypothetical protein
MKIKNKLMIILCLVIFINICGIIWWNVPGSLTNIKPSDVSKIGIFDGNTGTAITITKISDIEHIINNLNAVTLKKEKVSLGRMGYSFKTTIYKANGKVYREFIINSSDTIRNDPFFYKNSLSSIDYAYIRDLIKEQVK